MAILYVDPDYYNLNYAQTGIEIFWESKVIFIPKFFSTLVTLVPNEIRDFNVDSFRKELKDLEDAETGMVFLDTHRHFKPVTVGGVDLARVVEIINGYTMTFENGNYSINLNGANNNIGDVLNLNSVQVRSSNSAGLTFSKQIEDQSFTDSRVYIDIINGQQGSQFPLGTPGSPVNNLADAQLIINNRTLPKRLHLIGSLTVLSSEDISDFNIKGSAPKLASMIITNGAITNKTSFETININGNLNGSITCTNISSLNGLIDFEGSIIEGGIEGVIVLDNVDMDNRIEFIDCYSRTAGTNTPTIDCNNVANLNLNIRGFHGGLKITNFSLSSMLASIDVDAGTLIIDSTCTFGTIVVRGNVDLTDNSGPGCTVISIAVINKSVISNAVWDEPLTGTTHNIQTSTGKRLREVSDLVLFDGSIHIDTINGSAGIDFPIGTSTTPSNNITDARIIADSNGITSYAIKSNIVLNADHLNWRFENRDGVTMIDIAGFNIDNSFFSRLVLTGTMQGAISTVDCTLQNLLDMDGTFLNPCFVTGVNSVALNGNLVLFGGFSSVPGSGGAILDMRLGSVSEANFRAYSGDITIRNFDITAKDLVIDMISGEVILEPTCTDGTITIRGVGVLIDNSNGSIVNATAFINKSSVVNAIWDEPLASHTIIGTSGEKIDKIKKDTSLIPGLS